MTGWIWSPASPSWAATTMPPQALSRAQALATEEAAQTRCCESEGWLRTRRGDIAGACAALERGLARRDDAALRARLGRLLVTSGRFHEALGPSRRCSGRRRTARSQRADVRCSLVAETQVLALAYAGDGGAARTPPRRAGVGGRSWTSARSGYLRPSWPSSPAMTARALEAYRRAYELPRARPTSTRSRR